MRLPKDAVAYLLQQTDRTRKQVLRLLRKEIKTMLSHVDWPKEGRRLLRGMRVQVKAEVRILPAKLRPRPRPADKS